MNYLWKRQKLVTIIEVTLKTDVKRNKWIRRERGRMDAAARVAKGFSTNMNLIWITKNNQNIFLKRKTVNVRKKIVFSTTKTCLVCIVCVRCTYIQNIRHPFIIIIIVIVYCTNTVHDYNNRCYCEFSVWLSNFDMYDVLGREKEIMNL